MSEINNFTNLGISYANRPKRDPAMADLHPPRTLILTGLARSGTSMLAQAVKAAGVFIGASADNVVHEDAEIADALNRKDLAALDALISNRNISHDVWAFKRPNLHAMVPPQILSRFRNPHVVVIFRDIAAIAQRNAISEQLETWPVLEELAAEQQAQIAFLRAVRCPLMLVSYEKALAFPDEFVRALGEFVGGGETPARKQEMRDAVEPNRNTYTRSARRHYDGVIDYIVDGILSGWAREPASAAPVQLTLLLDDLPVLNFVADQPRPDLVALGFGGGQHGFSVNIRPFLHRAHAIARVRVNGRTFELEKSGRPLGQLITR